MTIGAPVRSVVIVGGGTAGWMTAAALARLVPTGTAVTLVESDAIGTVGVGEATIPPIRAFNAMLGIDEAEFLAATAGSFKLGIEFVDWAALGERYLHPFGGFGFDIEGVRFHQYWRRRRAAGVDEDIGDYALCAVAARAGRFAPPSADPASILSQMNHAYHFDAGLYAQFLRARAERGGVRRIEGEIVEVTLDGETGHVRHVALAGDRIVAGDLFIDCSGFRGLLIEEALGAGYEDWTRWLPCDRAVAMPSARTDRAIAPFTRSTARPAGWQWRIPLQHRTGNGYVYSSAYVSDDEAAATLVANVDGRPLADPRVLRFTAGRRRRQWIGNVVALGLASGFAEPLESTSLHMVQTGISKLLALFPDQGFSPVEIATYNRLAEVQFDQVRDFLVLHYHATRRTDSPFWRDAQTRAIPDALAEKIALWRRRGRLFRWEDDLFAEPSWVAVLLGQGIVPEGWDRLADGVPTREIDARFDRLRTMFADAAARMPRHEDYLANTCPTRVRAA
ncbi:MULTISPECIES: tryptophan halogenase family protein [Sphingomonas]|uniref:Tryptophan halogenase n=2 Tax=Sphingomonas TaxID=13687 RepID=A0A7W9BPT4_9SPHN|nr:tryptophan halogenase family protein [Sphingomonas prati]MBB5727872.1 tryptophan halogenase [Sphingomonas prati]GGE81490.1 tryptophan halogenase [Sphingomonas prati]